MKSILHVGCGNTPLPAWMNGRETRVDIDPASNPDIVADMRHLDVSGYDVLYCSHALEHLYPYEVVPTLKNFKKALNTGGAAIIIVPNLSNVRPTNYVLYESPAGPITGLDMIYGKNDLIEKNPHMAHHTGFVHETLTSAMDAAGFNEVRTMADTGYNLIGVGLA